MPMQQRNSILCPNCRKLISRNDPICPYCETSNPGAAWKNNKLTRSLDRPDLILNAIVFTNIGMYLISLFFNPFQAGLTINPLTFLSPDNSSLFLLGATGTIPIDRFDRWWTLLSANYLHGSVLHIFFNMMAIKQLAPFVMHEFGTSRMLIIYTVGGTIGFLVSFLARVELTIGASAALCALIGAILYYSKSRGGVYGQRLFKQVGVWVIGLFLFGLLVPGINNWGHGGGLVGGALLAYFLKYNETRHETHAHKVTAIFFVILTVGVLAWAVASGIYYRISG